ncbi:LysR family transcriptional regulator [Legionella israelensis]|uniref:LysR family transcriptional regulator n=1 Tax=Legionella israelensis TaxID=454 RepID=UPI001180EC56|nr:LysR family transcriptional regulator [Legionella israelensis]QDP73292.1 LysR family transcriptional regulator [Legionella israelensis]
MSLLLSDIKYFIVVSETLNVTRSSEIIGISQPALSYAIKRLERKLGGALFIRLKNGVQLTKLGEEFQKRSHRLLYEWEQAQNIANPESGLVQGSYTIAIHPSVALYTLEFFLPKLQIDFPKLDFNFIHGLSREMAEKVISWEADFGIIVNPIEHPDLVIRKLCIDEVTIFYAQDAQDKLIYDKNLVQSQYILKKIKQKIHFSGMLNSSNLEVVAKLASLGLGYGILPTRVASQYHHLIKLKDAPVFRDEICLVYRPEKHNNSVSKRIIQAIKALSFDRSSPEY